MEYDMINIDEFMKALINDKSKLDFLLNERGLDIDTINKYMIGFNTKNNRYTIPIFDNFTLKNIRFYSPNNKIKTISVKDHGKARVYPIDNLTPDDIFICEGELDCLVLNKNGYNAVTGTAGVATFKNEWVKLFYSKNVNIVFDCDEVGRESAKKVQAKLLPVVKSIKIIDLGLKDKEDITDYFVTYNKTTDDFDKLIEETKATKLYKDIHINDSLKSNYVDKRISFKGIVIGKDLSPYLVPKKVHAKCKNANNSEKCLLCPLSINLGGVDYEFEKEKDKDFIMGCIGANDKTIDNLIRRKLKIPGYNTCRYVDIKIHKKQSIEDLNVIPAIDFKVNENQEYVIRRILHFADNNKVTTNSQYKFYSTTSTNPNNQSAININFNLEGDRDDISTFKMTDKIKKKLKIFQPKSDSIDDMIDKLKDIYTDFKNNVTRIHKRLNVMMATDLVFHSVLHFKFKGKDIHKGWLETTIFGDTTTGKSETVKNMFNHYQLGEFISSGENATLPGILGGVQQTNNGRWSVTWGKIPINNHRVVALDEADELAKAGIISKLSGVRRSGVAEIIKIQPQRTTAMTRLIIISNPIKGVTLQSHNYGLNILKDLYPAQQDLARVDFAIAVSKDDVEEGIFDKDFEKTKHVYTKDICKYGVLFAWSRTADNIKLSKGIENYIIKKASKFSSQYVNDFPLALHAEMKYKIARMAIALATRLYSTDETGENVIVKKGHVDIVVSFLTKEYNNPHFGFLDYSEQKKRENMLNNIDELNVTIQNKEIINFLLDINQITVNDIEDIFNCEFHVAKEIARNLRQSRAIVRKNQYYIKTPAFITYLKQRRIHYSKQNDFINM